MEELTLLNYVIAKERQCQHQHTGCTKCSCFVNAGKTVLEQHIVPLAYLWNKCFAETYDCEKAQRKLLQISLVSINVSGKVFMVEKELGCTNYESKRNIILGLCAMIAQTKRNQVICQRKITNISLT